MKILEKYRYTQAEADEAQKKFMDKFNSDFIKCKNRKQRKKLYIFKCYNCGRSITWNHLFIGVKGILCKSCVDAAI